MHAEYYEMKEKRAVPGVPRHQELAALLRTRGIDNFLKPWLRDPSAASWSLHDSSAHHSKQTYDQGALALVCVSI
jgi:hypothetical protein